MTKKELAKKQPCACAQAATDLQKSVQLIKDGMLKKVMCSGCGKTFLTNFETEYCYDCRKKFQKR